MPATVINPLLAGNSGGSWFPSFSWGSPAAPEVEAIPLNNTIYRRPAPLGGANQMLPPPDVQQMPPVPQGSGTSTAWGGPQMPNASTGPAVSHASGAVSPDNGMNGQMPPPDQKYSFMDNPGASDAMVAFGAAMLKAPDFNTGLGDAALAVNQVAQKYRMPTEQDYARAKMLGMTARLSRGYDMNGKPSGGSGQMEVDRSTSYVGQDGHTYFDATDAQGNRGLFDQDTGTFVSGGVPGLSRDVYDYGSNRSRRAAGKDADIEADFVEKIPGIASTASQFNELYNLASDDTTGIDSSFSTRVARQLTTISPEMGQFLTGLDPNNITEFNNRLQNAALAYASNSFKGQGQVTENERLMIQRAVGEPGTLTKQSAMLVFKIMRDAEVRKLKLYRDWSRSADLRDSYGNNFGRYQAEVLTDATLEQMQQGGGSAPQQSAPAGNPELEDALKQYGG